MVESATPRNALDFGFLRVAAATPTLRVADCSFNATRILELMRRSEASGVAVLTFPELSITGYTCGDLFQHRTLLRGAESALGRIVRASEDSYSGITIVGLPVVIEGQLYNCAAVVYGGKLLGLVPKSYIPNYKEFYERRWFTAGAGVRTQDVVIEGLPTRFGTDLLFSAENVEGLVLGVEICEDLWVPIPPSSYQALRGATVLVNPSASNEVIGKSAYRRQLVGNQSGRCLAAYVYAACGVWESTTDVVFGGHCLIAENGVLLAEAQRFQREDALLVADIDLERLQGERMRTSSFGDAQRNLEAARTFERIQFSLNLKPATGPPARNIEAHPFVPRGAEQLRERCEEIFETQVAGLARRLETIGRPPVAIGISGGLDSTLALLVACKTFDRMEVSRKQIQALTMPGFGTTSRTRKNALALIEHLGVSGSEKDIRELCLGEMRALGQRPFGIDLSKMDIEELTRRLGQVPAEKCNDLGFENIQARMRTSLLMNTAFVVGTGDLSELALGWCTYNADHMSMYNPNASIPKTLVKFLVRWVAENEFAGPEQQTLLDITATEISPELLPTGQDGRSGQSTENAIGPYELHDFFLYHFLRFGEAPEKILYLASQAHFDRSYTPAEVERWLGVFIRRFFGNQFKRSCLPDGPKVGTVSLSPRGDWRMPSDAEATLWLAWEASRDSSDHASCAQ
jgi:NAD+ synthase (glutamine-hydrolysing)